ncbi:hypothetical protein BaRGS_00010605 [Batillaria attramentaria]|uniref:Uncharacterized protein n=1 Tax=Batillaria attramentaria TaxID=370345 RepID=A0ABD0LEW8_9CAEN
MEKERVVMVFVVPKMTPLQCQIYIYNSDQTPTVPFIVRRSRALSRLEQHSIIIPVVVRSWRLLSKLSSHLSSSVPEVSVFLTLCPKPSACQVGEACVTRTWQGQRNADQKAMT